MVGQWRVAPTGVGAERLLAVVDVRIDGRIVRNGRYIVALAAHRARVEIVLEVIFAYR